MPLFPRKGNRQAQSSRGNARQTDGGRSSSESPLRVAEAGTTRPEVLFQCQLAHGSPTGLISGFNSLPEMYSKIAECYEMPAEEILYCTLNSECVEQLFCGQIGLDDFIFAHQKGQPKEVEVVKTGESLGMTITDNGAGYAFIKRIKENSIIAEVQHVCPGDHIEKINGTSMVGKRHYEVARVLQDIPVDSTFTLRLIEPRRSGFEAIRRRTTYRAGTSRNIGNGRETLRFKANGSVVIGPTFDGSTEAGINSINVLLDTYLGICDLDLAARIWELSAGKANSMDLANAIDASELSIFAFNDDLIIEFWGAITDARRLA